MRPPCAGRAWSPVRLSCGHSKRARGAVGLRVAWDGGGAGQRARVHGDGEGFLLAAQAPSYHGTWQNPPTWLIFLSATLPQWLPRFLLTSDQNSPGITVPLIRLAWSCWFGPGWVAPHRAWPRGRRFLRGRVGCGVSGRASWQGEPQLLCPRYAHVLTPYMNTVPAVIAKASAIHNPIIYAITHPKYRCGPPPGPSPRSPGHGGPEAVNGGRGWPSFLSLVYALVGASSSWE